MESPGIKDFSSRDVLAVPRLPAKGDKIPVVLIGCSSPAIINKFSSRRSTLRALAETGNISKMFLSENLSRNNRDVFWQARSRPGEKGYRFVWLKNGKTFAKK